VLGVVVLKQVRRIFSHDQSWTTKVERVGFCPEAAFAQLFNSSGRFWFHSDDFSREISFNFAHGPFRI
jgi:hypothetical protein